MKMTTSKSIAHTIPLTVIDGKLLVDVDNLPDTLSERAKDSIIWSHNDMVEGGNSLRDDDSSENWQNHIASCSVSFGECADPITIQEDGKMSYAWDIVENDNELSFVVYDVVYHTTDICYGFVYGRGLDGGFGDYSEPIWSNLIVDHDGNLITATQQEVKDIFSQVNDKLSNKFYSEGEHSQYDGMFPMEVNSVLIPVDIPMPYEISTADKVNLLVDRISSTE